MIGWSLLCTLASDSNIIYKLSWSFDDTQLMCASASGLCQLVHFSTPCISSLFTLSPFLPPSLSPFLPPSLCFSVCGLSLRTVIRRFYCHTPPTSTAVSGLGVEPVMGVVLLSRVVMMVPSDAGDITRFENEILRTKY